MQFIVIAYDGTDDKALERRMAVREKHLKFAQKMFDEGKWLYASAILNDDGKMIGSMIVCDYPSRSELEEQWLKIEPYILGNVWQKINVHRAMVAQHGEKK
ncbi:MAG: YciI family protein [Bacteroidota bacterium]